jgi:mono/diheme cytochrome c family protein
MKGKFMSPVKNNARTAPPPSRRGSRLWSTLSATVLGGIIALGAAPLSAQMSEAELIAQGQEIFETGRDGFGCADCHGADVVNLVVQQLSAADYEVVHAALIGIVDMAAFTLTEEEERAVAAYLDARQPDLAPGVPEDPMVAVGRYIFESGGGRIACTDCHGIDPIDTVAPFLGERTLEEMHDTLAALDADSFMALTEEELRAVAAYLDSLDQN